MNPCHQEPKRRAAVAIALLGAIAACASPTTTGDAHPEDMVVAADPAERAPEEPDNLLRAPTDLTLPADATPGGTLRRALPSRVKGFNWLTETSQEVAHLRAHVHDTLARRDFDDPNRWVSQLAHKVTANEDHTEFTIHLRSDVSWQQPQVDLSKPEFAWLREPRKLKPEDIAFYFELIQHPHVESGPLRRIYRNLEGVEVIDEHTLRVRWKKKDHHSLALTLQAFPMPKWLYTVDRQGDPLPKETFGVEFNRHWANHYAVGVGPYTLVSSENRERIVLERFDRYWGKRWPIDRIEYRAPLDPQTAYARLTADEIDILPDVPLSEYEEDFLQGKSPRGLEHQRVDVPIYYYFGWNLSSPLFSDSRVRRAMTQSLNRPAIIRDVYHGLGSIQRGPFPAHHPGTDPAVEPWPYDLGAAASLLEEAGWRDSDGDGVRDRVIDGRKTNFEFVMLAYDKPTTRAALAVWVEDLRKIGVIMKPQHVEWHVMYKKLKNRDFQAYSGGWQLSWDADPYPIWHSSQPGLPTGANNVGFRNEEADKIIEALQVTLDQDRRVQLYHALHRLLHQEQPYTFFFSPQHVTAWQPRLENVIINRVRPQHLSLPWYLDDPRQGTGDQD